ncbi:MAG: amidohydrolase family protein [Verrucomicrobiae bacterium]|nr:amidohydrolase family protein [Verrucomicrobiae bacterium]
MNTITRRQFIATAAAAAGSIGCKSVAPSAGPVIIDTHTHFYDPTRPGGVPWPPASDQLLSRTTLPKHYRAQPVRRPVTATVVVEASDLVEDNQFILDLAKDDPFIVGFSGNLPLGTPEFTSHLKRFTQNPLWSGMRHRGRDLAKDLQSPEFIRDVKRLADADRQLDVLGQTPVLDQTDRLARQIPDLRLVIDHLANTRIDGKNMDPIWESEIRKVARNPNVYMKVSGLVEGTGRRNADAPADVEFYRPWLDVVWSAFGEDRLVYGSNWPVSSRFAPLTTVQSLVHDYFSAKGERPLRKVFSENARRLYHWRDRV